MESVQIITCQAQLRASVVVLHGYGASAAANVDDARVFVNEHTEAVLPDAPGHGFRRDGRLERLAQLSNDARHEAIRSLAATWADELTALAAACRTRGAERVGLVGISMGGLAAVAALRAPSLFDAVAAILASPVLLGASPITRGIPPLLVGIAGRDEAVAPASMRRFALDYGAELHEYPESSHLMREADWHDLWTRTAAFFRHHLT